MPSALTSYDSIVIIPNISNKINPFNESDQKTKEKSVKQSPESAKLDGNITDADFSLKFAPDIANNEREYRIDVCDGIRVKQSNL